MRSRLLNHTIHKHIIKQKARHILGDRYYRGKSISFMLIFLIILGIGLIGYGASVVAQYSIGLPSIATPFERKLPESTQVYDDKGNVIYTLFDNGAGNSENRIYVPLSDISHNMKMAMIAAEDINFYHEDGIDPLAIARSFVHDIFSSGDASVQGASTITQQLVKYTSLTQDRTIERKIKEIILTLKITQAYSKDQILEAYLNAVPFGGDNYGIQAAAQAYFNENANQLDLAQSAFLAGLVQAPGVYSPLFSKDPDAGQLAIDRQHYVLDQMLKYSAITHITKAEYEQAYNESLTFAPPAQLQDQSFDFYVRDELYEMYGENYVNTQGLKVYTTLDQNIQNIGQSTVTNGVKTILAQGQNAHNGSLIALNASNGNILAMVGSANYTDQSPEVAGDVNMTLFPISPGSSVKPFVYELAFEKDGETPDTIVNDVATTFDGGYTPLDWDDKYEGNISISKALLDSRNIPAVETAQKLGFINVYNQLVKVGEPLGPSTEYGLSLAIGACDVPLLDHTDAYDILSQDGVQHPARSILYVTNKYGKIIYDNRQVQSENVLPAKYVQMVNSILKNYPTLAPIKAKGYVVAGKTGTSQDDKDNLFMGYSSSIVVGIWSGNTNEAPTSDETFGETTAAPMANTFFEQVLPLFPESGNF